MILIREQGQTFFQISFQNWNQYMLYCIAYTYKIYNILYHIRYMQTSNFYNRCSFIFIISDNLTARYKLQFVSFQMTGETPDKHNFSPGRLYYRHCN